MQDGMLSHVRSVQYIINKLKAGKGHRQEKPVALKSILNHSVYEIKVITKLPNSEQYYKGKVQTHNYINRQNQSTTGKL